MLKKIPVPARPGMFIQEFCGDWMSHPFWRAQFKLKPATAICGVSSSRASSTSISTPIAGSTMGGGGGGRGQAAVEQEIVAARGRTRADAGVGAEEMSRARKVP